MKKLFGFSLALVFLCAPLQFGLGIAFDYQHDNLKCVFTGGNPHPVVADANPAVKRIMPFSRIARKPLFVRADFIFALIVLAVLPLVSGGFLRIFFEQLLFLEEIFLLHHLRAPPVSV